MATSTMATADAYGAPSRDRPVSAVSWGAIFAGAAAAAALSLILLVLGTGLGLTSLSPYAHNGVSAMTLGVSAIVWVMVTQALASGLGGYLAGRLRSRWVAVHTDEVYFRDTAHGFLAWAVASLLTAALLTSAIGSIVGGAAKAGLQWPGASPVRLSPQPVPRHKAAAMVRKTVGRWATSSTRCSAAPHRPLAA